MAESYSSTEYRELLRKTVMEYRVKLAGGEEVDISQYALRFNLERRPGVIRLLERIERNQHNRGLEGLTRVLEDHPPATDGETFDSLVLTILKGIGLVAPHPANVPRKRIKN
jgi:hypothetical protein